MNPNLPEPGRSRTRTCTSRRAWAVRRLPASGVDATTSLAVARLAERGGHYTKQLHRELLRNSPLVTAARPANPRAAPAQPPDQSSKAPHGTGPGSFAPSGSSYCRPACRAARSASKRSRRRTRPAPASTQPRRNLQGGLQGSATTLGNTCWTHTGLPSSMPSKMKPLPSSGFSLTVSASPPVRRTSGTAP
eukprot:scaffold3315_cov353-Prasinococcus_capsulatus_cf.AAC.5